MVKNVFKIAHLVLILILVILVIFGMIWNVKTQASGVAKPITVVDLRKSVRQQRHRQR